jgi:hypothetical protein
MQYPVYQGAAFMGYMDEEDCRDMLRESNKPGGKRNVRVCKRGRETRLVIAVDTKITKTTAMRDAGGNAMVSTQREELYSGFRKEFTDGPVTKVITVLRRPGKERGKNFLGLPVFGLEPWRETDRFPAGRYNPDLMRPMFDSLAQMRAVQAEMAAG